MFLQNAFLKRKRKHENVIKVKEKRIKDIPLDHEVKLTFHFQLMTIIEMVELKRIRRNWQSGKHELRETTLAGGPQSSGPCHLLIDMNRNNLLVYQHQPRLLRIFDRSDTTYQHVTQNDLTNLKFSATLEGA
jgi:hypothetical protein